MNWREAWATLWSEPEPEAAPVEPGVVCTQCHATVGMLLAETTALNSPYMREWLMLAASGRALWRWQPVIGHPSYADLVALWPADAGPHTEFRPGDHITFGSARIAGLLGPGPEAEHGGEDA